MFLWRCGKRMWIFVEIAVEVCECCCGEVYSCCGHVWRLCWVSLRGVDMPWRFAAASLSFGGAVVERC